MDLDTAVLGLRQAQENAREHPSEEHGDCVASWYRAVMQAQQAHAQHFYGGQASTFTRQCRGRGIRHSS
jgi:hypothetical protein